MPSVRRAKSTAEATMLPGMIDMIVGIVATGIMSDPMIGGIDVRRIGMAGLVAVVPLLRLGVLFRLLVLYRLLDVICLVSRCCLGRLVGGRTVRWRRRRLAMSFWKLLS